MTVYEYKVVPAPTRGEKVRGLKTGAERFAHTLETLMNAYGSDGWEYVRADTLPAEERTGFTGRTTVYQNLLVFRRPVAGEPDAAMPAAAEPAAEPGTPLLSFPRLRIGPARPADPPPSPRTEATAETPAPRLGPATGDTAPRRE